MTSSEPFAHFDAIAHVVSAFPKTTNLKAEVSLNKNLVALSLASLIK